MFCLNPKKAMKHNNLKRPVSKDTSKPRASRPVVHPKKIIVNTEQPPTSLDDQFLFI